MSGEKGSIGFVNYLRWNFRRLGMIDGRFAFRGPLIALIDLTNKCGSQCICCWNYSPLLGSGRKPDAWYEDELEYHSVAGLLQELKVMGTREIIYSGGGDPLMYPHLLQVLSDTAEKGIKSRLITNFVPEKEDILHGLAGAPVDSLAVNLWAASEAVYRRMHPRSPGGCFTGAVARLREMISSGFNSAGREIILNNVLTKLNFREFWDMARMAHDLGANNVWYTTMDLVLPAMRPLLLNETDIAWLLGEIEKAKEGFYFSGRPGWNFEAQQLEELERRLRNSRATEGIYHSDFIDDIPCYAGWTVARVTANGNVCPCCTADRMPLGNIYKNTFREIWYSAAYNEFRQKAKTVSKRDTYFRKIACWRVCDNWAYNRLYHAELEGFERRLQSWQAIGKAQLQRAITAFAKWFPDRQCLY